jgi:hypothetical protein
MKLVKITALLLCLLPQAGRAWGIAGHAMIAEIAEWHLTPAALAEMRRLLAEEGFEHLDQIGSWADEIRPQRKEASPWHYVDIPLTADSYDPARDCPKGDCVIDAINRYRAILADKAKPAADRREALKFLVHFIGDIQMPLHGTENAGDHGGNKVLVRYFEQTQGWGKNPLNLHTVWDATIIERHLGVKEGNLGEPNEELHKAELKLAGQLNEGLADGKQELDPVVWAMESHDLAAKYVYPGVVEPGAQPPAQPVQLGEDYDRRAWPVIEKRIQQGGLRLAAILNRDLAN